MAYTADVNRWRGPREEVHRPHMLDSPWHPGWISGTVLGFIQALSGVQPDTVGDVAAIPGMVSRLLEGMSTALYTTLVGSALNIWLMLNYRLLEAGSVHLLSRLVERGESDGRV